MNNLKVKFLENISRIRMIYIVTLAVVIFCLIISYAYTRISVLNYVAKSLLLIDIIGWLIMHIIEDTHNYKNLKENKRKEDNEE